MDWNILLLWRNGSRGRDTRSILTFTSREFWIHHLRMAVADMIEKEILGQILISSRYVYFLFPALHKLPSISKCGLVQR